MSARFSHKPFLWTIIGIGSVILVSAITALPPANIVRFALVAGLSIIGAMLKVSLPGVNGSMSVNFLFVLLGIVEIGGEETIVIGAAAVMLQRGYRSRARTDIIQIAFNVSSSAIAIALSGAVYESWYLRSLGVVFPILLAITACTYYLANTLPIAGIISLTEDKSLVRIWRDCYFWVFPVYLGGALMVWAFEAAVGAWGYQVAGLLLPCIYVVYSAYRLYLGRLEDQKKHAEEQKKHAEDMAALHLRTIEALALAIDAKDHTTHDHLQRVQTYAVEIGKRLGLNDTELDALRAAALLHDIGKLAVPEHIISKPGKLTPEEFDKMKIHPVVGAEILERVKFPYPVVPIVRAHHEKWNGAGYPDGLEGEEIPLGARILSAVDCLDALASDRQYRRALPLEEALRVVVSESGVSFDPAVVEVLQREYSDLEVRAMNDEGRCAISKDIKVERGDQPAAGFVGAAGGEEENIAADRIGFLESIAAARHEVQALFELSNDLGASLCVADTLSVVTARLKRMAPYDCMAVYLVRDGRLLPEYVSGADCALFSSLEIPVGQGLSGWVVENNKPILNGNPSVEPGYSGDPDKFSTLRSAVAVPLTGGDSVIGALALYHSQRDAFSHDHLRVLLALAPRLGVAIQNSLRFRQAEDSATTDYLTRLPNSRSLFLHLDAELSRCKRTLEPLAVIVGDLNGFKGVNDRFGHLAGNELLKKVAKALRSCCREYDYVARMGGDEFVIVMPNVTSENVQEKINTLDLVVRGAGRELGYGDIVSISAGAATYPHDGTEVESLLADADRRMYAQKKVRRASPEVAAADVERLGAALQRCADGSTDSTRIAGANGAIQTPAT